MLVLLQTTNNNKEELLNISNMLLEKRLIACAQIHKVKSAYIWLDEIIKEKEFLLNCKTDSKNLKKIYKIIRKKHSYNIPEFITIKLKNVSKPYKKWLLQSCKNKYAQRF
ncbi:divalent-cation tolerance protein CutA [Helicobacter muridarum]|uniref:Divalent-cation tolerance protein CutA n=1 Tax=Helicobacter muridarum TaxID=216 RepID=A0A099TVV5_9HELI|nr:divalent cation tolerance protein CutA [Helicobacter muridarum]TLE01311.1 divalent-cation tolerance protein CutA [Helicobacter muridarum]STQ87180.1 divalent cation tolerance protein CutA [Helicobacter muridarum]